ncbi:unnamed protein product [Fraxinus pennsylvanica]|uniref:Uncharacterized protein n=1 Tax=Fraxinus pennsylvanica TaxID=56036 RepID=A0AAD2DNH9_9LAMI|nr:unnamed protein product [Fraxinus pennsylvanica]
MELVLVEDWEEVQIKVVDLVVVEEVFTGSSNLYKLKSILYDRFIPFHNQKTIILDPSIHLLNTMNFFKSILSEDSDPPKRENPHDPKSESPLQRNKDPDDIGQDPVHIDPSPKSPSDSSGDGGIGCDGWSFGGLIKTFTTQSESVLETYRRDLREFGLGLRKESEIILARIVLGFALRPRGNAILIDIAT